MSLFTRNYYTKKSTKKKEFNSPKFEELVCIRCTKSNEISSIAEASSLAAF